MSGDRVRHPQNLPPKTREAAAALDGVCQAARALAGMPAPTGRGAGQELIEREMSGVRERVAALTEGSDTLDSGLRSPYRLMVVGPSQAGKSTLINVIAGHLVLPTTGVGDAKTLKETVLTYSSASEQVLRVRYITKRKANERRFALERYARNLPDAATAFVTGWSATEAAAAGPIQGSVGEDAATAPLVKRDLDRPNQTLIEQIKTIIYPEVRDPSRRAALPARDQESLEGARPADWVDGWRLLLGQQTTAGGRYADCWQPRLHAIAALLGTTVELKESALGKQPFLQEIERHTAEGLAFLVDRVELSLPAENLAYMDVEDLPGVGNFGDPAADVARDVLARAMRERDLDGLLVVTRQNGLDMNTANLVEEAAVLKRALQGETDLGIAITHVDQIARKWAQDQESEGTPQDELLDENELLGRAGKQAAAGQQSRLQELLRHESEDVEEPERSERIGKVLARTRIVGIEASAAEAHFFNQRVKKKGAFATTLEGTGVPELIAHFRERAQDRHARRLERVVEQAQRIREALQSELERIARDNDVAEAQQLAAVARDAYLAALKASQLPLSNRWATTRERTAAKLEHIGPTTLPATEMSAQKEARKKKKAIIRGCRTGGSDGGMIHWKTMKAALVWGGTWSGAHRLDLPGDLALSLMPELLKSCRTLAEEVAHLLTTYAEGAGQLLNDLDAAAGAAAGAVGIASNATAVADARKQLQADQDAALSVLRAELEQFNEQVQPRLRAVLKDHFETECKKVLERHPHGERYPQGYTAALLEAYDEIGDAAIETGTEEGIAVLSKALGALLNQIKKRLFKQDPVTAAYRRLIAGIHDVAESSEVLEGRTALVEWARGRQTWLKERFTERKRLFDKFTVLADIRTGGMSRGYKVADPDGRICFLKVVDKHSSDERALNRELQIYERLYRKGIDGVLDLLDLGQTETEAYIVLSWADGGALDAIVPEDGMDLEEVLRVGRWLGEVVARLHGADIVHRDIKPANILRHGDNWALGDFGIAKNLTKYDPKGTVLGVASPGFAPPEQVRGDEAHGSMDVYAIGKVVCFLATNQTDRDKAFGFNDFRSTNLYKLMMDCTRDKPSSRPTIADVVRRLTSA